METCGETAEFSSEYAQNVIEEVIKKEKITDYTISVTVASGKGENFLGILRRIKVVGTDENGDKKELHLILKQPPEFEQLREKFPVGIMYNREVIAYNVVLPKLVQFQSKFSIPEEDRFKYVTCYDAVAETFKEYLVLEDMKAKGFKMSNRRQTLDAKHLKLALNTLANFHALSFAMKHEDPEYFAEFTKDLENPMTMNQEFVYFVDIARDRANGILDDPEVKEKFNAFGENMYDKMMNYLSIDFAAPYNVMCHGDCWNNNMLFKYDGAEPVDIVFVDWQIMRHASPITDIAYLIFSGSDEAVRRDHYEELLDFYYDTLKKRLQMMNINAEDVYPEAVYRDNLKLIMPIGLIIALMLVPMVVSEVEDVPDMDAMLKKDKIELSDIDFENKQSALRYEIRMRGIINDMVRLKLI